MPANLPEIHTIAGSAELARLPLLGGGDSGDDPPEGVLQSDQLSASVGPGGGLPESFAPTASFTVPFSASAPSVDYAWPGTATEALPPGHYLLWLTRNGTIRRAATLVIEAGPTGPGPIPLATIADLVELTAGTARTLDRDAGDLIRALNAASEDLRDRLAARYSVAVAGARVPQYVAEGRALIDGEAAAGIASDPNVKAYVCWRAAWHLTFASGTGDAVKVYRQLRADAADEAGKALGRIAVDLPGFGTLRMGSTYVNAVR